MNESKITIKDIEGIAPFSRGSTEIFLTGHWSPRKPLYVEKTSPCRGACPIGNDIARAFAFAAQGNYDEALRIFRQDNPLPGVCGRVCYHPCETGCNRKEFDEAINIRGFERFLSDRGKVDPKPDPEVPGRKEKVAVIGSGPAGLSAAYHLARLGFPVMIYEALPEPGGMLMYGIPEYRLPKDVLRREIGYITQLGVEITTGFRVGVDRTLSEIKKEYDAVFIAAGAHGGMRLNVPGEEFAGAMEGVRFLRRINLGHRVEIGPKVAVIGGGNTAVDCARAARRLGGEEVTIIYRRSRAEMPALAEDVKAVEQEGIRLVFLAAPKRILAENGRVSGIECISMTLGTPDASGRPEPTPVAGSEFIISADTILAAVGQVPETEFVKDIELALDKKGMIDVAPETFATSVEGVFAGGDSAGAKAFVADAIASGKMGALAIYCYLEGKNIAQEYERHRIGTGPSFSFQHFVDPGSYTPDLQKIVSYDKVNTLCFSHQARSENPEEPPEARVGAFKEVTGGLDPLKAESEVARCFKCGTCTECDLCYLLCPDISITKADTGGYGVKTDYCKGCAMCATTCPRHVIEMTEGGRP